MEHINDDTLSAYIDGELPPDKMQEVRVALAQSETLRSRMQAFENADDIARACFIDIDQSPFPAGLEAMIKEDSDTVVPLRRNPEPRRLPQFAKPAAIAASVALCAVLVWRAAVPVDLNPAQLAVTPALDTQASGYVVDGNNWRMEILATRQRSDGDVCRDLMLHTPENSTQYSACLNDGEWSWKSDTPTQEYVTATGGDAAGTMSPEAERHWLEQRR